MKKFEYKSVEIALTKKSKGLKGFLLSDEDEVSVDSYEYIGILNELGRQGWEVISSIPTTENGWTLTVIYTLKREYE